jgi:hypothetical protein
MLMEAVSSDDNASNVFDFHLDYFRLAIVDRRLCAGRRRDLRPSSMAASPAPRICKGTSSEQGGLATA